MRVHHSRITPKVYHTIHLNITCWRETIWIKVSCLRKEHNVRDQASNHRTSDLKSSVLSPLHHCTPTTHCSPGRWLIKREEVDQGRAFNCGRKVKWNLNLTKCEGTGKIGSLYRGFIILRFFSRHYAMTGLKNIICYTKDFVT